MAFKQFIILRRFSTSAILKESLISPAYKSKKLWDERFKCPLLSNESLIRPINNKIISGLDLNNLEVDVFINFAVAKEGEVAQLKESARLVHRLRRSLHADTLLPSSHHALCRLFLYSKQLNSLLKLLEHRVDYGIFPDHFALNLLLDYAMSNEDFLTASRIASLVMLQEEFGINPITDALSLYSIAKLLEAKSDFEFWSSAVNALGDSILDTSEETGGQKLESSNSNLKKAEANEQEDEEEDAEYIRIPFLRNPYIDDHFDLKTPRALCGKSLVMLGRTYMHQDNKLGDRCIYLGHILKGDFDLANKSLQTLISTGVTDFGSLKEISEFYINNLHGIDEPSVDQKEALSVNLQLVSNSGMSFSDLARSKCNDLEDTESRDIEQLKSDLFIEWPKLRQEVMRRKEELQARRKLIDEIKAKKEELRNREQYLYFYDNLKKSRLTRIEYN